ncbi:hypothetical protein BC936DRAFT_148817 [Jimgerdemannia flammicorona]|uniref:VWFA domain-containing protein n=1 Tax=Jimgerdemannia flammicorona TaxID=994334 RepID=A0A433D279_9FUNG|nr:hypothetical protein BC936DRAFT_148817 [Jimgerdemannia flammicorona]
MAEATFEQVRRKHDSLERRYHQLLKELDPATDKKSKNVATSPYGESEAHTRRVFSHDGATSRYGEPEATLARRVSSHDIATSWYGESEATLTRRVSSHDGVRAQDPLPAVRPTPPPKTDWTSYDAGDIPAVRPIPPPKTDWTSYDAGDIPVPRPEFDPIPTHFSQRAAEPTVRERQTAFAENERQTAFAESERQTAFAESEWQTAFAESERQTEFGESDPRRKRRLDAARLKRYNKQTLDLAFLVDCTGSMSSIIKQVHEKLQDVLKRLNEEFSHVEARVAFVGYRDFGDEQKDLIVDFDTPEAISTGLKRLKTYGGGDLAEDVLGGYANVLVLSWSSRYRVLIHFGDAPPHGKKFHTIPAGGNVKSYDRFYTVDPPYPGAKGQEWLDDLTRQLCEKSIFTNFFAVGSVDLTQMENEFRQSFARVTNGGEKFQVSKMEQNPKDFVDKVLMQVTSSMLLSGARRK